MIHLQLCSVQGKKDLSKFPDVFLQIAKCICASELQSAMCWASKSAAPIRRVSEHFVVIEQLCICPNCEMYYPNLKMYLSKSKDVFIQISSITKLSSDKKSEWAFCSIRAMLHLRKCIFPNCKIYYCRWIAKWSSEWVNIL